MKQEFKIGDKVINPDLETWSNPKLSPDGNHIGEIKELNEYKELPSKVFAWVQFRDYACGFLIDNLKKAKS